MVDEPARPVLEQAAVGVGVDRLLVLHRPVGSARLGETRRVVEKPGRDRLKYRDIRSLMTKWPCISGGL